MRTLCLMTFGVLVGLVIFSYDLKLTAKALDDRTRKLASEIQDESDFLALMRAEVSHLSRPGRIDALARSKLNFEPVTPLQTVPLSVVLPQANKGWQPEIARIPGSRPSDGIAALIDRSMAPSPRAAAPR